MDVKGKPSLHNPSYVAVDLGAGSGRVISAQVIDRRLQLFEVNRFSNPLLKYPGREYQCWGIDAIEEHVRQGIARSGELAPIQSVGVDSWGVDYVLLDRELKRVGQAISYRDRRTEGVVERVTARIPASTIYRKTGIQFQPYNTLYQLAAMANQEPDWINKTCHLLMIPDYLHFRLCGALSNEYTNATTTQLLNLNGEWDQDLFAAAGLTQIWMQPPVQAGTLLGEIQLGHTSAKVIAPATHDTASAVVGTPLESDREAFISSGTWSLMGMESMAPISTDQAMHSNFSNEGGFGRRYRVLKNIMGLWLLQRLCEESHIPIDDTLLAAAAEATPWRSLVNPDDSRFLNPLSMQQAIRDYCMETGQPVPDTLAQFARCVFESLALSYRIVKEELERLCGHSLTRIRIVGGGSRNQLLNQLCANTCQLPISAGPVEASALGNVCVQMITLGEIAGLEEARTLIRRSFDIQECQPREQIPDPVWRRFQQFAATSLQEEVR
jgi:rhamnulokinase